MRGLALTLIVAWAVTATSLWLDAASRARSAHRDAYGMLSIVNAYRTTGERCLLVLQRVGDGQFRFPGAVYMGPELWTEMLLAYKDSSDAR